MTITERIFVILAQKGLSQKEFAKMIEVNEKTVSAWKKIIHFLLLINYLKYQSA